jgi:hypothetical protein
LDTGVEVEVRPAGRNVRRLSLLSGGERSLVAMAYLFAVFRSRPSPFYLMDEVEAALDDVNLMRFLALVNEFREEAQLIIVSHQKRTMEAADALYGVTMAPGGSSKVVSQKVPRDRTAVDTLDARPTTKLDPAALAPADVPELGGRPDAPDPAAGPATTEAAPTDGDGADDVAGPGPGDDLLTDPFVEPERREGPVIAVPPPRVDVGGMATGRGEPGAAPFIEP